MFQGFSQETVDFMWGIRFNNERTWFMAHKEEYQKHFYYHQILLVVIFMWHKKESLRFDKVRYLQI